MFAHSPVAAVSDRRRRSEIDATIPALRERRYKAMRKNLCRSVYIALSGLGVRIGPFLTQAVGLGWVTSPLWGSTGIVASRAERAGESAGRSAAVELQQFCYGQARSHGQCSSDRGPFSCTIPQGQSHAINLN